MSYLSLIKKTLAPVLAALLLAGCGGGSSSAPATNTPVATATPTPAPTPSPTPSPAPAGTIIGANDAATCRQAGQNDASACFIIDDDTNSAEMYGVIGSAIGNKVTQLLDHVPRVTNIILIDVPGSENDEANIPAAQRINDARIATEVRANSSIASGGVDFFIGGSTRVIASGASIGVHSWSAGAVEGSALPRDDPQHQLYIDFYTAVALPDPSGFYFFTLDAAPSSSIHIMTEAEIAQWGLATN